LLGSSVASSSRFSLVHEHLLICLPRLGKHRITSRIEEALSIPVMDSLSGVVPASVVSFTSVSTSIDTLLSNLGQLLISHTTLDVEQLLRDLLFLGVAH